MRCGLAPHTSMSNHASESGIDFGVLLIYYSFIFCHTVAVAALVVVHPFAFAILDAACMSSLRLIGRPLPIRSTLRLSNVETPKQLYNNGGQTVITN